MKNKDKNYFFNMHCDVHYYPAKFEIKIQLVDEETRKKNSM